MRIDLATSALQLPAYFKEDRQQTIIVVDVLRASTTITTAIYNGAKEMIVVEKLQEAMDYAEKGYLVGAERKALRCDFARFGNSPYEYQPEIVHDKTLVFTTTNGTKCIERAFSIGAKKVYIGGIINLEQATNQLLRDNNDIIVLAAGWNDTIGLEDCIYAGAIAEKLIQKGAIIEMSDGTFAMRELWQIHGQNDQDLIKYIANTEHYKRMKKAGVVGDVPYCLTQNDKMPFLEVRKEKGKYLCRM